MDTRNINTRNMTETELKPMLREQAREEKRTGRFIIWSENGNYFSYEDSADDVFKMQQKVRACSDKNGSRTAILATLEDRVELVPSPGRYSSFRTA